MDLTADPAEFEDTIPTPATADDGESGPFRIPAGDHATDESIHSLEAVSEQGEALRADGTVAPDKDEEKWRGE